MSLVEQLSQLSTLHASGALTANEFALAKGTILRTQARQAPAESDEGGSDAPAAQPARPSETAPVASRAAASVSSHSSPPRRTGGLPGAAELHSSLLPLLSAAVAREPADGGDAKPGRPGNQAAVGAPSSVDAAIVGLRTVLVGDDEAARRGALRTLERGGATLCAALTTSGDAKLCADVVSGIGAALHAASHRSTRRFAAGLLATCGGCSGVVRTATWSWLFEPSTSSPQVGLALLLESLPDGALFQALDGLAQGKAAAWRDIFSSAEAGMAPQRWLGVLIRLLLACGGAPLHLAALQMRFGGAEQLAETLVGFALKHATKQAEVANATTAGGGAYDAQFGDVGAHTARLLALRLLALRMVGPELTPPTLSSAVAALRDASVEGASSVRIGIVGVAGLFGLASQIRAQGVGRAAGAVLSAIAAIVAQPTGPRW